MNLVFSLSVATCCLSFHLLNASPSKAKGVDGSSPKSPRPHIVMIVADDLGFNDVSFHGSDQIPTPNIDFLAYNGIILQNYYVSPLCTPTRSEFMTGRHPIHTGQQNFVIHGSERDGLSLNFTLMPEYLNQLGYRSHMVGKWHLGYYKWDYTPTRRGFESHFGYFHGREDYWTHMYASEHHVGLDFVNNTKAYWGANGTYSTNAFRDAAVDVIKGHNDSEPLFLYLPFQSVHCAIAGKARLEAPQEIIDKFKYIKNYQRRVYAAMVSSMDDAVGAVYDTLRKKGILDNTIIVFTTDNGGPANGYDANAANNFPLRGVKNTLWEGGVHGVGLIHSPLLKKQGYVSKKWLHACDWLPTLYTAAGGDSSKLPSSLDGKDAWNMLNTDGSDIRHELLHNIDPIFGKAAIRVGDYKLLTGNINQDWDGWYKPWQLTEDDSVLHILNHTAPHRTRQLEPLIDLSHQTTELVLSSMKQLESQEAGREESSQEPSAFELYSRSARGRKDDAMRQRFEKSYKRFWPQEVVDRMEELYAFAERSDFYTGKYAKLQYIEVEDNIGDIAVENKTSSLSFISHSRRIPFGGEPVRIACGPKPANATTNCDVKKGPCLFDIISDPCEYNNVAPWSKEVVNKVLKRLQEYRDTMVKPDPKPFDPRAFPERHGGAWMPWL